MSNSTLSPSARLLNPDPWIALWWTKQSFCPSEGVMKPKPFASLNHLTVPVVRMRPCSLFSGDSACGGRPRTIPECLPSLPQHLVQLLLQLHDLLLHLRQRGAVRGDRQHAVRVAYQTLEIDVDRRPVVRRTMHPQAESRGHTGRGHVRLLSWVVRRECSPRHGRPALPLSAPCRRVLHAPGRA